MRWWGWCEYRCCSYYCRWWSRWWYLVTFLLVFLCLLRNLLLFLLLIRGLRCRCVLVLSHRLYDRVLTLPRHSIPLTSAFQWLLLVLLIFTIITSIASNSLEQDQIHVVCAFLVRCLAVWLIVALVAILILKRWWVVVGISFSAVSEIVSVCPSIWGRQSSATLRKFVGVLSNDVVASNRGCVGGGLALALQLLIRCGVGGFGAFGFL